MGQDAYQMARHNALESSGLGTVLRRQFDFDS